MALLYGAKLMINTNVQSQKAEELEQLVETIVNKIEEIDEEVKVLVQEGIIGESAQSLLNTYLNNREVLSGYVKKLAGTANLLYEDAQTKKKTAEQANIAAGGGV